ncbi:uncharacterized protein BO96DRAFT_431350 [Aspergillus niger CBS 101883]|uniref:uncharacterized protein n=1 Tax=Aspergillus lacticoffeatus (strain CBS 101883) TaxID=1450533 RepID=UPI000D7F1F9C|nr:uncharacterized protein BO96DRAFT_431350 [Aspergillus niger CBS 101883]PYH60288.1 hypothetical protein BO96DRAFT_431350 [Aspergillus niger CBS 101883]
MWTVESKRSGPLVQLTEQMYSYWADCQNLRNYTQLLQAQLDCSHRELARCHQNYIMEYHKRAQAVSDLMQLQDQFRRLNNLPVPVHRLLELETRSRSLKQAEIRISQRISNQRAWAFPVVFEQKFQAHRFFLNSIGDPQ